MQVERPFTTYWYIKRNSWDSSGHHTGTSVRITGLFQRITARSHGVPWNPVVFPRDSAGKIRITRGIPRDAVGFHGTFHGFPWGFIECTRSPMGHNGISWVPMGFLVGTREYVPVRVCLREGFQAPSAACVCAWYRRCRGRYIHVYTFSLLCTLNCFSPWCNAKL